MQAKSKKRAYSGRNTGIFYALIAQLPEYETKYKDLIKEGTIDEFLKSIYGCNHGRELRLSVLSDMEYREMINQLQWQVDEGKKRSVLQQEAIRKKLVSQILTTLSRIGVSVVNGNYNDVNYHIKRLPISKGRIIPQFRFDELENLLGAVRAYCDNIKKAQRKEQ